MRDEVRCNMMDKCDRIDCGHYSPHEMDGPCGVNLCPEIHDAPWCVPYQPHPDAINLADMILEWWEGAQALSWPIGDGDWGSVFEEEPDFVTEARKIKEEVTE